MIAFHLTVRDYTLSVSLYKTEDEDGGDGPDEDEEPETPPPSPNGRANTTTGTLHAVRDDTPTTVGFISPATNPWRWLDA